MLTKVRSQPHMASRHASSRQGPQQHCTHACAWRCCPFTPTLGDMHAILHAPKDRHGQYLRPRNTQCCVHSHRSVYALLPVISSYPGHAANTSLARRLQAGSSGGVRFAGGGGVTYHCLCSHTCCVCSYFLHSCHATHGRAKAGYGGHGWWEDDEYDDEGEIVKDDYLDYVFVGDDFRKDGEMIRCAAVCSIKWTCTMYRCFSVRSMCACCTHVLCLLYRLLRTLPHYHAHSYVHALLYKQLL